MKHTFYILPFTLFSGLILSGLLQAAATAPAKNEQQQPPTPPPQTSERPERKAGGKPPADAIKMCQGKAEKTKCSMNGPRGEEKGFCEHTPDKLYFACNPQRGPAGQAMPPRKGSHQNKVKTESNSGVSYFPLDKEASYLKSAS